MRGALLRPLRVLAVAAVTLAAVLGTQVALASPSAARGAKAGTTLTIGMSDLPRTLFVPTDYSTEASWIMVLIQGQMLTYGPKAELQPAILQSWKQSGLTYTYQLRPGVKFSDGNPVTAADIAYTLNLQLDPKVGAQEAALFTNVKSVTGSGSTVTMTLKKADPLAKFLPATIAGFVYEQASVSQNVANYGTPQVPTVGAGPYMVSEYAPDSQMTLVRNPNYYGTKPQWDTIVFKAIPDPQTLLLALRSGEIDGTLSASTSTAGSFKSFANVQSFALNSWSGLTMDMTQKPFSDLNVRKALYYATDVNGIAKAIGKGYTTPAVTINDPLIYQASLPTGMVKKLYSKIPVYPYSIDKAKAALAASSVPKGFSTTLNVPEDSAADVLIAQVLKNDWAKIGVKLKIRLMPGGPRFQIILDHKKNLGIQIIGNAPDAPDPHEMPWEYFDSSQAVVNGNNSSNFKSAAVDKLLAKAAATTDAAASAKLPIQAQALAAASVPIVNLSWGQAIVAFKKGWSLSNLNAYSPTSNWIMNLHSS
jgi:peptide/nickel transport system substrate-binding protein